MSVYQEKHRSWNILTRVFYVLSMGLFAAEAIIVIMGVIGILVKDWDVIAVSYTHLTLPTKLEV